MNADKNSGELSASDNTKDATRPASLFEDLESELARSFPLEGGETITAQRWIVRLLVSSAARGNPRAIAQLFALKLKLGDGESPAPNVAADAQAFDDFIEREVSRRFAEKCGPPAN